MITLIDILSGERHTATTPVGIDTLKASWRFSTDFPVAVDRGISSDNLKFYKGDRAWLLDIFDQYGTSAVVDMEFESNNLTFSVALDFSTAAFDDIFFEVGYKFSRLADKIKELDEVGKIEIEPTDRVEYQLNNKVQVTYEQLENKEFSGRDFYFEKTSIVGQKKLVTVLGPINAIGLPPMLGVTIAQPLGWNFEQQPPVAPIVVGNTTCEVSYLGFGGNLHSSMHYCSIMSWPTADEPTDVFSRAHIEGRWNFGFVLENNATNIESVAWFAVFAQYRKTGQPDAWRFLSGFARTSQSLNLYFSVDNDLQFPEALNRTYNGVTYDSVDAHFVLIPYVKADLATGFSSGAYVELSSLLVSGVKITHSVTRVNRTMYLLPVNRYFEKLGLFVNLCAAELENALITSQDIMNESGRIWRTWNLQVKPTDVMHDISLLYAVKFVEKAGKYVIMRLDEPTPEIEEINQFSDVHYTALPCYTGAKIAGRNSSDSSIKYIEQIFTGTAAINDTRIAANILQLSTNLTTDGGQIVQELINGNGTTAYLIHAENVATRQLSATRAGRQINEYYMFREVVSRLLPFIGSWVRPLQPLELSDCDPFYNHTTGTGSTDPITPPAPMYQPTTFSAKIPVTFALVRAILSGCKRLKINGLTITLKDIEINTEPSVAEISGFIENQ